MTYWLHDHQPNIPPMPFRLGLGEFAMWGTRPKYPPEGGSSETLAESFARAEVAVAIREAGRYAIRATTRSGHDVIDPDQLIQHLIVGMLGYWTDTALSDDPDQNPRRPYDFQQEES